MVLIPESELVPFFENYLVHLRVENKPLGFPCAGSNTAHVFLGGRTPGLSAPVLVAGKPSSGQTNKTGCSNICHLIAVWLVGSKETQYGGTLENRPTPAPSVRDHPSF